MGKTAGSSKPRSRDHTRRRLEMVVVDPLAVVRAGLGMLIEDQPDMRVLAGAGSADECLAAVRRTRRARPVILVGLGLPGERDSLWLIGTLRGRYPLATILASGAGADAWTISRALFMGADGYLDKDVDPSEFLQAIRRAALGEVVLAGAPTDWVGFLADGDDKRRQLESRLTPTRARGVEDRGPGPDGARDRASSRRPREDGDHASRSHLRQARRQQPGGRGDRGRAIASPRGWLLGG